MDSTSGGALGALSFNGGEVSTAKNPDEKNEPREQLPSEKLATPHITKRASSEKKRTLTAANDITMQIIKTRQTQ